MANYPTYADIPVPPTAAELKADRTKKIVDGDWVLYWHSGRDMYVVRPSDIERDEGDEFRRLADARRHLRDAADKERRERRKQP